ncbi:tungsten ABC transporter substrate-binding protein [Methanoculleus sp. FWC-SCC1]|uniref:Tungsten ABC transporter substrate-binding protein n=1 Tax=Methanoculleus frigidifontis TaxID=2584085 RepID=A0ABT8MDH6_9EURY|nr:substrate-binding domain-containing protein [Methanoculleus sp. FWC-SCC1]MDN7025976.1 tungsten ABC transporter substrate-binding protein [Methanoculleus sp. FWC-SCC1]
MDKRSTFLVAAVLVAALLVCGCTQTGTTTAEPPQTLRIATTTSLYDTGLLDSLVPGFEKEHNAVVQIVSAGTGKAIEYGQRGDVDILMVHDRAREDVFLADGYGLNRRVIAYNYFVIVGPESDPAGIAGMQPEEAFQTIYALGTNGTDGVAFISRGDNSGTHSKEKAIWKSAGYNYTEDIQNSGAWYIEAGKGMGDTLVMTNEKQAYTLSDIGTFLAYKGDLDLVALVDSGAILLNVYSVMEINPAMHAGVNTSIAQDWINYMVSDDVQQQIEVFGVAEYGQPLFFCASGKAETIGVPAGECATPLA